MSAADNTRTCIHTPADPLEPEELSAEQIEMFLEDSKIVYFDGRLTKAALRVAKEADAAGIPVTNMI